MIGSRLTLGGTLALIIFTSGSVQAGMPEVLPSSWTANSAVPPGLRGSAPSAAAPYLQGISFFVAVLLLSAWAVKGLWKVVRRDFTWLPPLGYGRSLSLVVLWGL